MFIPVKPDFHLSRIPYLTILTCALCLIAFLHQLDTWQEYELAFTSFCEEPKGRMTEIIMSRVAATDPSGACYEVLLDIDTSPDPAATIQQMAAQMKPLVGLNAEDSRTYVLEKLNQEYRQYQIRVPRYPDNEFAYYTGSWDPLAMVTSSFMHGSWSHIIFNLIFFFAFATTVEILVGGWSFAAVIVAVSIFSAAFSSMAASLISDHYWTLGLSGVVMGMMGLFAYLLPSGRIRCYYWFIVIFGSVAVPAWALAAWYIGWDVYNLFANADNGMVDVMAHVTGGAGGYLYGVTFLRATRQQIRAAAVTQAPGNPPVV